MNKGLYVLAVILIIVPLISNLTCGFHFDPLLSPILNHLMYPGYLLGWLLALVVSIQELRHNPKTNSLSYVRVLLMYVLGFALIGITISFIGFENCFKSF